MSDLIISKTSGFDSYNPSSQAVINRMATIGPEATIKELEDLHAEHIRKYGEGPFSDTRGERRHIRQEIARIKKAMSGNTDKDSYYSYLGQNISDEDKAIFNNMLAA